MYDRILVALDGSKLAEQVLPHVEALATAFGSTVTLLQATTPDRSLIAYEKTAIQVGGGLIDRIKLAEVARRRASSYLAKVGRRLQNSGVAVESAPAQGSAAALIVDEARRMHTDLIAMTTLGKGGLRRAVFGSVADEVLRNAPCPVLLVRIVEPSRSSVG